MLFYQHKESEPTFLCSQLPPSGDKVWERVKENIFIQTRNCFLNVLHEWLVGIKFKLGLKISPLTTLCLVAYDEF